MCRCGRCFVCMCVFVCTCRRMHAHASVYVCMQSYVNLASNTTWGSFHIPCKVVFLLLEDELYASIGNLSQAYSDTQYCVLDFGPQAKDFYYCHHYNLKRRRPWNEETAQWLGAQAPILESHVSVPTTHTVSHKHLLFQSQGI